MNLIEFLEEERQVYGNLYSKLVFLLDDIEALSDVSTLKTRAYYKNLKVLKQYNELMDDIERLSNDKNKKLSRLFTSYNKDKCLIDKCNNFKSKNYNELNKIRICSDCVCLKCIKKCKFNPCMSCNKTGKVQFCNKSNINLITFDNFRKNQYNNETNTNDPIEILCEVEFLNLDKRFRIIKDLKEDEVLVLEFVYSIKDGDLYYSVDDVNLFNEIIEIYESNKF